MDTDQHDRRECTVRDEEFQRRRQAGHRLAIRGIDGRPWLAWIVMRRQVDGQAAPPAQYGALQRVPADLPLQRLRSPGRQRRLRPAPLGPLRQAVRRLAAEVSEEGIADGGLRQVADPHRKRP